MTTLPGREIVSATKRRSFHTFLLVEALARKEIGERIAQARREAGGMTQQELADLIGVTMRSVQGYELGEVVPWRHFERLEAIFQKPLAWFLHGDAQSDEPVSLHQLEAVLERVEEVRAQVAEVRALLESLLADQPGSKPGTSRAPAGN